MTENHWKEKLDQHPIYETLEKLRLFENNDDFISDLDIGSEIKRIHKVSYAFEDALKNCDPEIIPFNQIDAFNLFASQHILPKLEAFQSRHNIDFLTAVNQDLDAQLTPLAVLLAYQKTWNKSWPKSVEKHCERLISILDEKEEAFLTKNEETESEIEQINKDLFEISEKIEHHNNEIDSNLSEWETKFSEKLSEEIEKINISINSINSDYRYVIKEAEDSFKKETSEIISKADDKYKKILELYRLSAEMSVAGGYQETAESEKKQANNWRKLSISFIVVAVIWLMIAYFTNGTISDSGNIIWGKVLTMLGISGILTWGASYSAIQSTKHRITEKEMRWFALEVKAIDPFISSLDPDTQMELKKQLSEKLFGHSRNTASDSNSAGDEHMVKALFSGLNTLIGTIGKINK